MNSSIVKWILPFVLGIILEGAYPTKHEIIPLIICVVMVVGVWVCVQLSYRYKAARHIYLMLFIAIAVLFGYTISLLHSPLRYKSHYTYAMPSSDMYEVMINENYDLGEAVAILTGGILPLFALGCFHIASKLHQKKFTNPIMCAGVIFAAGAIAALVLAVANGKNAILSIICMALLTGAMHGVNLMLVSIMPAVFKKYENVSTASGVINSCTYIGSAISTYGIALLSHKLGWGITIDLWFALAVAGAAICLICAKPWQKTHE